MIGKAKPPNPATLGLRAGRNRNWSLLPIPALMVLMIILDLTVPPTMSYDPPSLILIGNTVFVGFVSFVIAGIAWRNYRTTGRLQVLSLGCAVLLFGMGGISAAVVRGLPGGANLNVTIYNSGALLGAVFHFVAALIPLAGLAPETGAERRKLWLGLGYGGSFLFMTIVTAASLKGFIPPFFIQDVGPTLLRQQVLGAADLLFVFSCLVFFGIYYRNREPFIYWYAGALGLTAISLTGFFIEHAVGSPVGWVGRFAQYLGGAYFLLALLMAARSAESRGTSLDEVLTTSLTGAEERFRSVFANAAIGFAMTTPTGRFVDANNAYCRILGYSVEELRALDFSQLIYPDDRAANVRQNEKMLAGEIPDFTTENRYVRKDGQPVWVGKSVSVVRDVQGAPRWVVAFIEDITPRKQAELALRTSEERFRSVLVNMSEGLMLFDAAGNLAYQNPASLRIHGFPESDEGRIEREKLAVTWEAWDDKGRPIAFEEWPVSRVFRHERFQDQILHVRRVETGQEFDASYNGCPLYDSSGKLVAGFITIRDISSQRRAQEALIRSEKLASAGRMAATIAHEINNPLAAVMNCVFLARTHAESPDKVRSVLDLADEELRLVAHLTRQTLGFYRESSIPGPMSVNGVCESAIDLLKSKIRDKQAKIHRHYHAEIAIVGVAGELRQIFSNLLSNSLDAIAPGGNISVSVSCPEETQVERHVTITVGDDGVGIKSNALAHIFEPFFTTKEAVGTGLGLWAAKQLVEKHGGSISVESQTEGQQRGTRFSIVLPVTAGAAREETARPAQATSGG